jgi:hypothetical protein
LFVGIDRHAYFAQALAQFLLLGSLPDSSDNGMATVARMATITTVTRSSINVKPFFAQYL